MSSFTEDEKEMFTKGLSDCGKSGMMMVFEGIESLERATPQHDAMSHDPFSSKLIIGLRMPMGGKRTCYFLEFAYKWITEKK